MENQEIIDIVKIAISVLTVILLFILTLYIMGEKEKKYTLICETRQEIIITDGEEIITIEKNETKEKGEG